MNAQDLDDPNYLQMDIVGKSIISEKFSSTLDTFWFAVRDDVVVNPFDFVSVNDSYGSTEYILIFIDEINRFVPGTYEQLQGILNTISERILRTIIAGRIRGTVLFSVFQSTVNSYS